MSDPIHFIVEGNPRAKQSYRAVKGGGYTDPGVKAWQNTVTLRAREVMQGREPLTGPVAVRCIFTLSTRSRVDCDNLNKALLDGLNGVVFEDDAQVVDLHISKRVDKNAPGVEVMIFEGGELPTS